MNRNNRTNVNNRMSTRMPQTLAVSVARVFPRRVNLYLGSIATLLLAIYLTIMIATILMAALETQLSQNIQSKQIAIQKLESSYYAGIDRLDATNPAELGYVTPTNVAYVSQAPVPGLSFAK